MKILIDADACPVVDIAVQLSQAYGRQCIILCDTSHRIERDGCETLIADKGADSVDFRLVNLLAPGDIAVTQDYGLAAMCLSKRAHAINQNGLVYNDSNIENLLYSRYVNKKIRMAGGRSKGPKKRTCEQNDAFRKAFIALLEQNSGENGERI